LNKTNYQIYFNILYNLNEIKGLYINRNRIVKLSKDRVDG